MWFKETLWATFISLLIATWVQAKEQKELDLQPEILDYKKEVQSSVSELLEKKIIQEQEWNLNGEKIIESETEEELFTNEESWHFEFDNDEELNLFVKYSEGLGSGMWYFANALVKWKSEFVANIIKKDKFDSQKTDEEKIEMAWLFWENAISKLFEWKVSDWWADIINNTPWLVKYIVNNIDSLSEDENLSNLLKLFVLKK